MPRRWRRIVAVPGLGIWSAEIYLLFALEREDVFPAGDLALAAAAAHLKGLPGRPPPAALRGLAEPWRPWRALAARLLWHHWRHVTGRPASTSAPLGEGRRGASRTQDEPAATPPAPHRTEQFSDERGELFASDGQPKISITMVNGGIVSVEP